MFERMRNNAPRIYLLVLSGMGSADRLCTSDNSGVRPPSGYEPARLSSIRLALARATCAESGEKTGTSRLRGAIARCACAKTEWNEKVALVWTSLFPESIEKNHSIFTQNNWPDGQRLEAFAGRLLYCDCRCCCE